MQQRMRVVEVARTQEEINPWHGRVKIVEPVAERFELWAGF